MLILRQKSFYFCIPHLKTPQLILPYSSAVVGEFFPHFLVHWVGSLFYHNSQKWSMIWTLIFFKIWSTYEPQKVALMLGWKKNAYSDLWCKTVQIMIISLLFIYYIYTWKIPVHFCTTLQNIGWILPDHKGIPGPLLYPGWHN